MNEPTDILQRIEAVVLPTPPCALQRLVALLGKDTVTADEIAESVELDPGLASRVLRLANSPALGASGVKSIPEAVLRVGIDDIRNMVLALSVAGAVKPRNFAYRPFWRHSFAVAHTTQLLAFHAAKLIGPRPESYAAGLLHDIGMVVFDRAIGDDYARVLETARNTDRPLHEVEAELLHIDHTEVGERLLRSWKLPEVLVDAARHHHDPWNSEHEVTSLVHLANFVCNNHGIDHGTAYFPTHCYDSAWLNLGIADVELPAIITEVQRELAAADHLLQSAC